jgi:hypothetical protein
MGVDGSADGGREFRIQKRLAADDDKHAGGTGIAGRVADAVKVTALHPSSGMVWNSNAG